MAKITAVDSFINSFANHMLKGRVKTLLILSVVLSCFLLPTSARRITVSPQHPVLGPDSVACRDDKGETIDWTLSYKLPKLEEHKDPLIADGVASVFVHKFSNDQWSLSKESMLSPKSIIGATVAQYWNHKFDLVIAYNDQPPNGSVSYTSAHAKGLVAISGNTGFWLSHSVPRFPDLKGSKYSYPTNGHANGQNLLCISLDASNTEAMNIVANHLLTMRPAVYLSDISPAFAKKFPLFVAVQKKKWGRKNNTMVQELYSAEKTQFTAFTKNGKFTHDLYSDLIAPTLKHDISVQSWRNGGGGKLPTDCVDEYKVMNVAEIRVDSSSDWKYTEDHSKWAISTTADDSTVCISDMNRMHSQFKRGGGAICIKSKTVWSNYNNITREVDPCPKSRRFF